MKWLFETIVAALFIATIWILVLLYQIHSDQMKREFEWGAVFGIAVINEKERSKRPPLFTNENGEQYLFRRAREIRKEIGVK